MFEAKSITGRERVIIAHGCEKMGAKEKEKHEEREKRS